MLPRSQVGGPRSQGTKQPTHSPCQGLQARAARASEEADKLRAELEKANLQCTSLSETNSKLEERVKGIEPLQEHLQRVTEAKDQSERELKRIAEQHRRVLREVQLSSEEVKELKGLLEKQAAERAHHDKEFKALQVRS